MEIPPIYWTILGEIAIVFIGILIAIIVVILKDRRKLEGPAGETGFPAKHGLSDFPNLLIQIPFTN